MQKTRFLGSALILAVLVLFSCVPQKPKPGIRPAKPGSVVMEEPKSPLFVGSYYQVPVKIDPATGLTVNDLEFLVPDGPMAGEISLSKDKKFVSKQPTVMLLVGPRPGSYTLIVRQKGFTDILGKIPFDVTTSWKDETAGPNLWFTGKPQRQSAGSAWGGGPTDPQNLDVRPASGTRRVALVLIDTSTQRYTTNATQLQNIRDQWMDEAVNGVTVGAITRSVAAYYSEVSYGNFTISAQIFGPYSLTDTFTSYFKANGTPKGNYFQAVVTAADGDINYSNFDSIVAISRSIDTTPSTPGRSAWPYASISEWGPYTTEEGNFNLGMISMPFNWTVLDGREIHETLSHEMGHNLGLGDQYKPAVSMPNPPPANRNLGSWEFMDAEESFPHMSAPHRMFLGWIEKSWIRQFDFSGMATPVDQTVKLHAVELGTPSSGRSSVVEIRIANGWNYYFEFRDPVTGQIGDQSLATPSSVLGTDVVSAPWTPPMARPGLLRISNDSDSDGSVLQTGGNYKETDTTDPTYPTDFRVDVTSVNTDNADIRIRYGVNSKPDPSIRPWPAGSDRRWQSPDIEIQNARNLADASLFNLPWANNPNTIIAKVKNNGNLAAPNVLVNFYVKDYTVTNAPETFLGSQQKNIPPGATVEFNTTWTPPSEGHYCIVVRIPLYQTGGTPSVVEMTELNNLAQSNYDSYISASSSPFTREITSVLVNNPYPKRTRIFLTGSQNNPFYRTYIANRWVILNPGETRKVEVMFEYSDNLPSLGKQYLQVNDKIERFTLLPNDAEIMAHIEDPRLPKIDSADEYGGVQARIFHGRATKIDLNADQSIATGYVTTVDDDKPVPGGRIIVSTETKKSGKRRENHKVVNVDKDGKFRAKISSDWKSVYATYLPLPGMVESNASHPNP